ncbi:MAG: hypothetical protein HYT12_03040 [Candidatus Liptonbacteria bacterium]|nr:hypothetical protein [Candidatus Liptonbacteria bacterium]
MPRYFRETFINTLAYYIAYFRQPWTQAMIFAGWAEYQEFGAYKERVAAIDCAYAINQFFDGSEWKYYFQKGVEREPMLYWKMVLFPWGIEVPLLLQIATNSGFFESK